MEVGLLIAIGFALAFALTNGFHDASNAIATLVATRGATAGQAVVLSAVFNMAGAVLLGTAVADTIGKIVTVPQTQMVAVVGAGLAGATVWNLLTWWLGLPSSSGHALVGGLAGAAIADGILSGYGGLESVNWGGVEGWHPTGVIGVLIALLISPPLGFLFAFLLVRLLRRLSRRWTTRWNGPVRGGGWIAAAGLSFSHGGNDAQKSMGVIAVLLLASGHTEDLTVPLWAKIATGLALTLGTALGGWRIVKTIGQRIFSLTPVDSFSSQTSSTAVILGASLIGAPVSTTQVVASSVVGIGAGRRRWRHVRWEIVREMGVAWLTTIPAAALMAVVFLLIWRTAL
ncbi:MAG TPA: inorganic phosphate transporter [Mycobacterium sp.]|nr:MAG: inorganic phosphate transporter [Mycobacterium sp.]HOB48869.1 inorganic phosphate transporter [Mycobacterium sp.]HPZ95081.1 inorganic phosphate transporter [Mycobacterium sp.]HQE14337.1 inorganic phosphate transporter [Mycobacterium sp.]